MTYHSEDIYNQCYNLTYNMDSKIVYDAFFGSIKTRIQHPFETILIVPLISLTKAFITSHRVAFNFLMSICASLSTTLIYLGMYKLSQNKKYSVILSLMYGFSYSTLVFSSIPEIYIFSGLFNILFLYYVILLYKDCIFIENKQLLTLSLLLSIIFGINPINFATGIIPAIFIVYTKSEKAFLKKIKNIMMLLVMFILISLFFILFQKLTITGKYNFISFFAPPVVDIHWLIRDMFIVPLYALKSYIDLHFNEGNIYYVAKALMFEPHQNFLLFIPAIIFYGSVIINYLIKIKVNKYNDLICILLFPLTISFVANMCSETPWNISLLYSQNFLPHLIFLIGLLIITNKNRFIQFICIFLIIWQIIINLSSMVYIIQFVNETALKHYPAIIWFMYSLITICILILIKQVFTQKFINNHFFELSEENKFNILIYTYIVYVVVWSVFLAMFHYRS